MEGVTECKLIDLIKFTNGSANDEEVDKIFGEYKIKGKIYGEIDIFKSSKGSVIRYTNSKDWINFINFLIYKNVPVENKTGSDIDNNEIIIIVDCGYQFKKLFASQHNNNILVIEFEQMLDNTFLLNLDKHIKLTIWSNVGLIDDYMKQIDQINGGLCNGGLLGESIIGVFRSMASRDY